MHWGPWANASSVLLPAAEVLSGRLDVFDALRAIPERRVRQMQRIIRAKVHRVVYAMQPPPSAPDAFDLLLMEAERRAGRQFVKLNE